MRPEVRARHARALTRIGGDAAFRARFERFFTELRDPLAAALRRRPAVPGRSGTRCSTRSPPPPPRATRELRALDHEREITPDWLHREQAVGYVAYVDRFAGTLQGVRERLGYLRELGVTYLHLMPLLRTRPEPNDGGYAVADYGAVEPALGTIDDLRELAADLRAAGMSLCVDVVLNHTAREHPWAQAALAGDPSQLAFYRTFADRDRARRLRAHAARGVPRHRPRQLHLGPRARALGVDDVQRLPVGPRLREPRGLRRDGRGDARARGGRASTSCGSTPCRSCGSASGRTARTSPRCTTCCRRSARSCGSRRRRVAFKAEAIVAPRDLVAYLGVGRHEGKECDLAYHNVLMVLLWSALASRRVALLDPDAARRCRRCRAGAGLAHLRPLPRRHRLGDHRRGRGRGGGGRRTCTAASWPTSTPATSPARSRAARASSPSPRPARRGSAARRRRWPGSRLRWSGRRARRRTSRCGGCSCTPWRSRSAGSRSSTWATSSRCATTGLGARTPRTRTTRAGCTARRWTGRPPPAAQTGTPPRASVGGAATARRRAPRAPGAARVRRLAAGGDGRSARPRAAARARGPPDAAPRELQRAASPRRAPVLAEHGVEAGAAGRRARRATVANRR